MTPVERAARALALSQSGVDCFDDLEPEAQANAIETVRAVLQAIREPNVAMVDAGWAVQDNSMTEVWQAMIDAALADK